MMLLFLVDSKKMMALGAPYVRGPTAPQLGEDLSGRVMARRTKSAAKQLRRLPDLHVHLA